jgi:uncharacterized membrane protein YhhN
MGWTAGLGGAALVFAFACALVTLVAHAGRGTRGWGASVIKTASVALLALAGLAGGAPGAVVLGLALGAAGDFFLSRPGDRAFVAGMVAFGAGHLAYAAALWHGTPGPVWAVGALLALALSTEAWLAPHTGALRQPVRAYVALIAAMGLAALSGAAPLALAGAVLFLASDTLLALERFVLADPGLRGRRAVGLAIWASYWGGQALILAGTLPPGAFGL